MDPFWYAPNIQEMLQRQDEQTLSVNTGGYAMPFGPIQRPPFIEPPENVDPYGDYMSYDDYKKHR